MVKAEIEMEISKAKEGFIVYKEDGEKKALPFSSANSIIFHTRDLEIHSMNKIIFILYRDIKTIQEI